MNKKAVEEHILKALSKSDHLIGYFQATQRPNIWLSLLLGPLAILKLRIYFIAVSTLGIHFFKLNFLNKISSHDVYHYDQIQHVKIGKGILSRAFVFKLNTGKKLKIKALLRGGKNAAPITTEVQSYITENVTFVQ